MLTYYTVPWSLHCRRAEEILKSGRVDYQRIQVDNRQLAAVSRDLGFRKLPVLVGDNVFCEGLQDIIVFVSNGSQSSKAPGARQG